MALGDGSLEVLGSHLTSAVQQARIGGWGGINERGAREEEAQLAAALAMGGVSIYLILYLVSRSKVLDRRLATAVLRASVALQLP
jgi:hypothetical protein